jgi:hypothetical protein
MSGPRLIWPVIGHAPRETIAHFFNWGDAASFAMRPQDFGAEKRNLYIGNARRRMPPVWIVRDTDPQSKRERVCA